MKRSSALFTVGVTIFLVIVFFMMQFAPRQFSWEESYKHTDDQPFGAMFFDSLMQATMPHGYKVMNAFADSLVKDSTHGPHSVLYVLERYDYIIEEEVAALLKIAERGGRVMIVGSNTDEFSDTLGWDYRSFSFFNLKEIENSIKQWGEIPRDTLYLPAKGNYPACKLPVMQEIVNTTLEPSFTPYRRNKKMPDYTILATWGSYISPAERGSRWRSYYGTPPIAVRIAHGKGYVYLVTPAYCFTNYGVFDDNCRTFVMRMMNELKDYPVTRLRDISVDINEREALGPLDFLARTPAMRLGWQLLVMGALLLLVVNARRRQRAIPVWTKSVNATIDLITQHASLYRKRSNYAPLLMRKHRAFAALLQSTWRVDVDDTAPLVRREQANRLAHYLGRDAYEVARELEEIDLLRTPGGQVTLEDFKRAMELMQKLSPGKQ